MPGRLMVGRWVLVPKIGVRVPARQHRKMKKLKSFFITVSRGERSEFYGTHKPRRAKLQKITKSR